MSYPHCGVRELVKLSIFTYHQIQDRNYVAPDLDCQKESNHTLRYTKQYNNNLTFPPVTEKFAKMQYFSFLWPTYVFKH